MAARTRRSIPCDPAAATSPIDSRTSPTDEQHQ